MKLWAKLVLWMNGYCSKHGTPKQLSVDTTDAYWFCQECAEERADRKDARVSKALQRLGHVPD